eukprot:scaffold3586_cov404-Prasinococcus_capsulatus_cf.AAC.33
MDALSAAAVAAAATFWCAEAGVSLSPAWAVAAAGSGDMHNRPPNRQGQSRQSAGGRPSTGMSV